MLSGQLVIMDVIVDGWMPSFMLSWIPSHMLSVVLFPTESGLAARGFAVTRLNTYSTVSF